ncbi:hypothetical protein JAO78_001680 [Alishewanella sp. 16-MA]|uniref:Uncharacterized protein n=1 Tax=Alishewanella maricola TaxID=2795740 RepID=A0ABS8C0G2_9ALTE|nr:MULTISPECIES: hypothetical protein [Gammaproteobacteria]MDP5035080.1 hypothetical protein [Alishewanella sp.]MDP5206146.1 hypothetical protein [Alishewanella sp. SMS9]MCB5225530.1 hypothetical protein [Alishewanella maricola]MCC5451457.1 hypothetical protein [Rheinheimera sp. UJ51]MCF4008202.1 hypothetical protein [Rheinheimera sp. UJ63]
MTMMHENQPHFWQATAANQTYTELCNALYERELFRLAATPSSELAQLPKRIASLPFYIRRAASSILQYPANLALDSQNASWYGKQFKRCPASKQAADPILAFYSKAAKPGLIVPLYCEDKTLEHIVLDSVDEVDVTEQRLHCNQYGWFSFSGMPLAEDNSKLFLLKPDKNIMTAACCGHQWLNLQKKEPRLLTLRELLLASRLNWRNFARPHLGQSS